MLSQASIRTALQKLDRLTFSRLEKQEWLKNSEWALKYRRLSREASSKGGGFFSFEDAPWQREPMDEVENPEVSAVVLMWASQVTGKTETVNNIIGATVDLRPCPILVLQPTLEMGETWSKDRASTMFRDTPRLKGKLKDARSRDSGNTLLHKRFPGGHLTIAGANSPASLASRPIRLLVCDEVDRYPASAGTEGDPVALAEKRTESFPDAAAVMVSTPGIKDLSRIEKEFLRSDQRYWFCPCPMCGHWQHLKWEQIKWDKDEKGEHLPDTARYVCEGNGCEWGEELRQKAVRAGEWRATAPFQGVRGYHLNGIYCLFRPKKPHKTRLIQMVKDFLKARKGGDKQYQVWWNTFRAETWEVKGTTVEEHELLKRCRTWNGKLHDRCLVIVGAADVQDDRLELEFIGYGEGNESWGLLYEVLPGDPDKPEVWKALDERLEREWEHPSGVKLKRAMFFIDCRAHGKHVFNFTRPREGRNIHACEGANKPWVTLCSRPQRMSNRKALKFTVGGDHAKDIIYSRLTVTEPGARYCHFPVGYGYDEEYFKQLTAEKLVTEFDEHGMTLKKVWKKKRDRNEALDIRCYALAALEYLNPNWSVLARKLKVPEPEKVAAGETVTQEVEPPVAPVNRPSFVRPMRRPGGFVGGWKKW